MLIDHDVETTVADPGSRRAFELGVVTFLKDHWRNATMSTRVLLGVVAILIAFLDAR